MKKTNKILLISAATLSAIAISTTALVINQFGSKNQGLNPSENNQIAQSKQMNTLTVKNTTVNVNDPKLSSAFRQFFSPLYPEDFKKLLTDTTKVQFLLKELVSYKDKKNELSIFETDLTFNEFYNKYSQAQSGIFNPDKAISFSYDDGKDKNKFSSIANGTMEGKITIGKDLKSMFSFDKNNAGNGNNGKTEITFTLTNLQCQFDLYFRNEAVGQETWNKNNVADDTIVRPFILEGKESQTLLDELKNMNGKTVKELIEENYIIYENENGRAVQSNDKNNRNKFIATNLSKEDFKKRNILDTVIMEPFVGSGKLKLFVKFNTFPQQNKWLETKSKSLSDDRGLFSQLEDNAIKIFWLGGWKKDYSFNYLKSKNNTSPQVLDAKNLILDPLKGTDPKNFLDKYFPEEIDQMIDEKNLDDLFKGLINFNAYLFRVNNAKPFLLPDKLLTTNLIFEEFKTLNQKNPFQILANNYDPSNYLDNFTGSFSAKLIVDDQLVKQHYIDSPDKSKYLQFDDNAPHGIDFQLTNLKKKMFFLPQQNNLDPQGYIKLDWLNQTTIKEFFSDVKDITNINNGDLDKIKDKLLKSFVKYDHQNFGNLSKEQFKIFPILSNAKKFDDLKSVIEIKKDDIKIDTLKGTIDLIFNVKFKNGILNNKFVAADRTNETSFAIPFKISGFKSDKTVGKYSFNPTAATPPAKPPLKDNVISIQEYNKVNDEFIATANQIDRQWILDNLIAYNGTAKPFANNKPSLFTTSATKEQFLDEMLYTNQNNQGINLTISSDKTKVDGNIYLKKEALNPQPNFDINPNQDYYVYHFQITDFLRSVDTEIVDSFNIQLLDAGFNLDQFNQDYLVQNLFSFADFPTKYYVLKSNLNKNDFLKNNLLNLIIEKDYQKAQATVQISLKKQPVKTVIIKGFKAQVNFEIQNQIYANDPDLSLVKIKNHQLILEQFMNFDGSNQNKFSILNTNISLKEFNENYLDYLNISKKDFQGNWLELKLQLKQPINDQTSIEFKIFFNKDQVNIYDINSNFSIDQHDQAPNLFNKDDIVNFISFNGSLKPEQAIFSINMAKEEFLQQAKLSQVGRTNFKNGSVTLKIEFNGKANINIDDDSINNTNLKSYEFSVFGFKANGSITFNNKVNAAAYKDVFDKVNAIGDFNKEFIFDNLISYSSNTKGIIGNTDLTRDELFNNTSINVYQKDKQIVVEFLFKSHLNGNQASQIVTITNLPFLGYSPYQMNNFIILASIFSVVGIGLIGLITWLIVHSRKNKKAKIIFKATNDNKIL